jgi:hypothetical protein
LHKTNGILFGVNFPQLSFIANGESQKCAAAKERSDRKVGPLENR